jgi:hypothetical protein
LLRTTYRLTSFGQLRFKTHGDGSTDPELLNLHENDIVPWDISEPCSVFQEKVAEKSGLCDGEEEEEKMEEEGNETIDEPVALPCQRED